MNSLRKRIFLAAVVLTALLFPHILLAEDVTPKKDLTLTESYQLALKRSETLAIQKELIREAEGRFLQSFGSIFPRARFSYTNKIQDGAGGTNFTLSEVPEAKFMFSQPLFSGFKEFAAMAASRAEKKQFKHEVTRAEQLLYVDVSDAFYFFLQYQEDLDALESTHKALLDRMDELKKRESLGRSRASEVLSAEAKLSQTEADVEDITSQRDVGKQLLEFLTGVTIDSVQDVATADQAFEDVSGYLARTDQRADVLAAVEAAKAAQKRVVMARSGYWPEASLEGNYYTKHIGNAKGVDWDTSLVIEAPVFEVGQTYGLVKEAKAQAKESELRLSLAKREANLDVRNTFTRMVAAKRRYQALEKAVQSSEKNYQSQKEDYQRSLVNNLEVLQALEDLQDMRRDFVIAKNDVKRLYRQFQASVGELPQ